MIRRAFAVLASVAVCLIVAFVIYGSWFSTMWGFSGFALMPLAVMLFVPCLVLMAFGVILWKKPRPRHEPKRKP